MTGAEYERLQRVFERALELAPQARVDYLEEECGDDPPLRAALERMLAEGNDTLELGAATSAIQEIEPQVGPYRVLMQLGEGGMGSVYLAEQREPLQRRVALKVVKQGLDTRAILNRFEAERQALSRMSHPNIARVLDAGATAAGRPYFVMEYVAGLPITTFCERHGLTPLERIALFRQVCQAIHHAHQKGIIHRDLKPANVLVELQQETPVAKVIDFGLARATDFRLTEETLFTEHGLVVGTPEYMSPEQAESETDIDTRTDIYALGVLLYELLVGTLPIETQELRKGALHEIQRRIVEETPPKPSTRAGARTALARVLRGDLDWITMRALEKDRRHRYQSAHELDADIERYLNNEPVVAGPPSLGYRLRKLVRRHKAAVAAAGAVLLVLLAGLAASTTFWLRSVEARAQAERSAREAGIANERYERLSDIVRLDRLRTRFEGDWTEHGDPTLFEAWLRDARALVAGLPEHRNALAALRTRGRPHSSGELVFQNDADQFLHDSLQQLVGRLEALEAERGMRRRMQEALEWSRRLRSPMSTEDRRSWESAIRAIRTSPEYGGLAMRVQTGLVPLGADRGSGLWEFGHPRSGAIPVREDGRLTVHERTCIVFVLVPGATLHIGAQPESERFPNYDRHASRTEGPPVEVALDPFFIAKHETTQRQWAALTAGERPSGGRPRAALPVILVSWDRCTRVASRHGLTLPTEAQWEHACRAGTTTPWWTGADRETLAAPPALNIADAAARSSGMSWPDLAEWPGFHDGFPFPAPVWALRPNPFGLHHVHGNVFEWCRDTYQPYAPDSFRTGDGLRTGSVDERVVRGGAFNRSVLHARSARRTGVTPAQRMDNVGVRFARELR